MPESVEKERLTLESIRGSRLPAWQKQGLPRELRSGEVARRAGVSADTLRHYEQRGLLGKPRRLANGYRAYPPEALDRVLLIQRALAVGFTLDELAELLRARDGGRPRAGRFASSPGESSATSSGSSRIFRSFEKDLLRNAPRLGRPPGEHRRQIACAPSRIARFESRGPFIPHARGRTSTVAENERTDREKTLTALLIAAASSVAAPPRARRTAITQRWPSGVTTSWASITRRRATTSFCRRPEGPSRSPRTTRRTRPAATRSADTSQHIASMFSEGNFDAPMLIHDRVPPGVPTMKRKKALIDWKFEKTEAGGRVRIASKDAEGPRRDPRVPPVPDRGP